MSGKPIELAERCEAAAEPDRLLDADIGIALFNSGPPEHETARRVLISHGSKAGDFEISAISGVSLRGSKLYTASLDAAMTLVPEWALLHFLQDTQYDNPVEKTWSASLRAREEKSHEPGFGIEWQSWCATPALALCAAALRARVTDNRPTPSGSEA